MKTLFIPKQRKTSIQFHFVPTPSSPKSFLIQAFANKTIMLTKKKLIFHVHEVELGRVQDSTMAYHLIKALTLR